MDWKLVEIPIKNLKDHPKNPRQISKDQVDRLTHMMDKFGLIDKPIVTQDNQIIGGHQRIRILKKKKIKTVECWVAQQPLSDEDIDELCIGLNLHKGDWDWDALANQWDPIKLLEYGFSEEQLLDCTDIEKIMGTEEDESEELQPPTDEETITKLGDLYELGDHRLICGDSTNPEDVEKVMGGFEPIIMVTDPPYGVNYDPSWRCKILKDGGKRSIGKVKNDQQVDWSITYSLFKGSIVYIWHGGKHSAEVAKNLENCDFEIVNQIIWNKQNFALSRGDYHWKHEPCWYAIKKGHQHNWKGDRKQTTVWDIANLNAFGKSKEEDGRTEHSTQKPLECMARPIQNHTNPGDWVYDPFLGSGTTLIAAEKLKRKCIGIEISPAYCDMIVNRYAKFMRNQGQEPKIKRNGEEFTPQEKKENGG